MILARGTHNIHLEGPVRITTTGAELTPLRDRRVELQNAIRERRFQTRNLNGQRPIPRVCNRLQIPTKGARIQTRVN